MPTIRSQPDTPLEPIESDDLLSSMRVHSYSAKIRPLTSLALHERFPLKQARVV